LGLVMVVMGLGRSVMNNKYVGNDPLGRIEDEEVLSSVIDVLLAHNIPNSDDIVWGVVPTQRDLTEAEIILYTEELIFVLTVDDSARRDNGSFRLYDIHCLERNPRKLKEQYATHTSS